MKLKFLILAVLGLSLVCFNPGLAQCPEDTVDRGLCDTLHVEVFIGDSSFDPPYDSVRVAIYVTHDLFSAVDSIGGFVIPLQFTSTNPAAYCSLPGYLNNSASHPNHPYINRSVFRHLVNYYTGDTTYNRMLKLAEPYMGWEWSLLIVRVGTPDLSNFRLALFPVGPENRWWWEGERVLLATMTFKIQDSTTICIDTTFWPPNSHLSFWRQDSKGYVPRSNLPYCFQIYSQYPKCQWYPGDVNDDTTSNISDIIYLINYLFIDGPSPLYCDCGDVNCDGIVDIADVVYYINYLFMSGPPLRSCLDCYYSK